MVFGFRNLRYCRPWYFARARLNLTPNPNPNTNPNPNPNPDPNPNPNLNLNQNLNLILTSGVMAAITYTAGNAAAVDLEFDVIILHFFLVACSLLGVRLKA